MREKGPRTSAQCTSLVDDGVLSVFILLPFNIPVILVGRKSLAYVLPLLGNEIWGLVHLGKLFIEKGGLPRSGLQFWPSDKFCGAGSIISVTDAVACSH